MLSYNGFVSTVRVLPLIMSSGSQACMTTYEFLARILSLNTLELKIMSEEADGRARYYASLFLPGTSVWDRQVPLCEAAGSYKSAPDDRRHQGQNAGAKGTSSLR